MHILHNSKMGLKCQENHEMARVFSNFIAGLRFWNERSNEISWKAVLDKVFGSGAILNTVIGKLYTHRTICSPGKISPVQQFWFVLVLLWHFNTNWWFMLDINKILQVSSYQFSVLKDWDILTLGASCRCIINTCCELAMNVGTWHLLLHNCERKNKEEENWELEIFIENESGSL